MTQLAAATLLIAACGGSSSKRSATVPAGQSAHSEAARHEAARNQAAPHASDPCLLVSVAEARAIVGRAIGTPTEAPLGPTCIYQPVGAKHFITVTVESIDFATLRPHIRDRKQFDVKGRKAYCGTYGEPTTFVPLGSRRVLNVAAPCAIGVRFAAKALPRLRT